MFSFFCYAERVSHLMDFQTIQTYNRFSAEYDQETTLFWQEFPREFVERFVQLAPGVVLNVGSGPGRELDKAFHELPWKFLPKQRGFLVVFGGKTIVSLNSLEVHKM
jgi:hypothetical protein